MDEISTTTRLIAMGSPELMEGFALLGFETMPRASEEEMNALLSELQQNDENAFVLLETYLAHSTSAILNYIRNNSGRIIVTEIPVLNAPDKYSPVVDDLICQVLGSNALDELS